MSDKERYELAEAEVERLENVIKIQQKQIERLLDQRDILERRIHHEIKRGNVPRLP